MRSSGTDPGTRGYGAHLQDGESGLLYMGARYYDPVLARFVQPDPAVPEPGDPQSWNRYSFVRNNPYNRVDPTGSVDLEADREEQENGSHGGDSSEGVQLSERRSQSEPVDPEGAPKGAGSAVVEGMPKEDMLVWARTWIDATHPEWLKGVDQIRFYESGVGPGFLRSMTKGNDILLDSNLPSIDWVVHHLVHEGAHVQQGWFNKRIMAFEDLISIKALGPLQLGVNHGGPIHSDIYSRGIQAQREYLRDWNGD